MCARACACVCESCLALDEHFCRAEVAQLDHMRVGVQQQVLRFYVSMADPQLCACVCVCVCVWISCIICTCIYINMHVHTYKHTHIQTHAHTHMHGEKHKAQRERARARERGQREGGERRNREMLRSGCSSKFYDCAS